ncbi:hypothetical protein LdCL_110018800 [Leishmania donovani]|uniref:Uncharacterized protein n=1 Tax=Leishmania donovani TaxID=5661 RepID=A0A3S7WRU4_LEIDO|nr:hypothetical protein LdCL_110018800 [Leishmania donovani]
MNSVSCAPLTEAEVRELSTAEIRLNLERCSRLLSQASLLRRLRDGGEGIRRRSQLFAKELKRRHRVEAANGDASTRLTPSTLTEALKRDNEAAILSESTHNATDAAREIAQKYKDHRVDVEATVRRMYEGILSESEIQRILQSVPPRFFLTYAETCEMERQLARDARKAELQKLAAQAARLSATPQ